MLGALQKRGGARRYIYIHMHKVSRDTYNRHGMSNMQLKDGPHGAWAGACRIYLVPPLVVRARVQANGNNVIVPINRDTTSVLCRRRQREFLFELKSAYLTAKMFT